MRMVLCSTKVEEAGVLARALVQKHLAACVQVIPRIQSVYRWEGELCEDEEALLLIKTDVSKLEELTATLKELHSYSVPEILSIAIAPDEGNQDYLSWLLQEVQPDKS